MSPCTLVVFDMRDKGKDLTLKSQEKRRIVPTRTGEGPLLGGWGILGEVRPNFDEL